MFPVITWAHSWAHCKKAHETGLNPWTDRCLRVDCASECAHPRRRARRTAEVSARDAAGLLGLSHQRVHQLTQSEAEER